MTSIIANRYRILSELGQGGMGTVYQGVDTHTNQTVAIKRLKTEVTTPELIERFRREGEALRELNHPNIVKMLDAIDANGAHYLVMEYVAGGDLQDLLQAGQLPVERCLKLALDLADALTRAHKLDIIHRDLKPANVLIAEDGTLRLTDFGVAHIGQKQRVTATDMIVGTVDYLAPEALDGQGIDSRADIWAFGVMLFEMLTGKCPFRGASVTHTLYAIATQPVPNLEALRSDAPVALIDLIYRMLEKDPQARITSVRYVGAELEDILQGRTGSPQQVSQMNRFATPAPDFLHRPKHNLPAQTTPFVGREAELAELAKLLDNPKIRLITIVAQGGMGKTRLSLEAAEHQLSKFEDGVYFVELAPVSDHDNIVLAIADATDYQFQTDGRGQKQQVLDFLTNKTMLLLMDNFEHLSVEASIIPEILNTAAKIRVLVTSRQRLNLTGETIFDLGGMDFPDWRLPEDVIEYPAVKLFMQSAKRVQRQFELTADNMAHIARICRLVQGMPLGIVLAAHWLTLLSIEEIAEEISTGINFLESDMGDLPERHRSIRAVFDYSWNLLSPSERDMFIRLSVFRASFSREAAQTITGISLRILLNLMNKSLIQRDIHTGRYTIHELLRQYAASLVDEALSSELDQQYVSYFANYLSKAFQHQRHTLSRTQQENVHAEIDNLQIAWDIAKRLSNTALLQQMSYPLTLYFRFVNQYQNALQIASQVLETNNLEPTLQAALIREEGSIKVWLGHTTDAYLEAEKLLKQAYRIYRQIEPLDTVGLIYTLVMLSYLKGYVIGYIEEGEMYVQEAFTLLKTVDEPLLEARLFGEQGTFKQMRGEFIAGLQDIIKSLTLVREFGTALEISGTLNTLGFSYLQAEQLDNAEVTFGEALVQAQSIMMFDVIRKSSLGMGDIARLRNDIPTARKWYQKCFDLSREINNIEDQAKAFERLARLAIDEQRFDTAARYLRTSLEMSLSLHSLHRATFTLPWIAFAYYGTQKFEQSIAIISCLEHHPASEAQLKKWVQHLPSKLRVEVNEETYNVAWERGKSLDFDTVVKELLVEFEMDTK